MLLAIISVSPVVAQNVRVEAGKRAAAIPKICESVASASIEGQVDIPALAKEADCKGAGDMMNEYTYVLKFAKREKDKKGQVKEETRTFEVYIPTLKSGMHVRGILLLTSHDDVPVPPAELEKERLRAGERLEKEEQKIARSATPRPEANTGHAAGMLPLGMYGRMGINPGMLGIKRGGAALDLHTFLRECELALLRREQHDGREMLVFSFTPRRAAPFNDYEKYIARLSGTIWIDAKDRIVTRLAGWGPGAEGAQHADAASPSGVKPPAVYVEMMRLNEGVWLPRVMRLNGADYPGLFDHVSQDSTFTYSQYQRFYTEIKDVKLETPKAPQ